MNGQGLLTHPVYDRANMRKVDNSPRLSNGVWHKAMPTFV